MTCAMVGACLKDVLRTCRFVRVEFFLLSYGVEGVIVVEGQCLSGFVGVRWGGGNMGCGECQQR